MRAKGGRKQGDANEVAKEVIQLREDGSLFQDDDSRVCENAHVLNTF